MEAIDSRLHGRWTPGFQPSVVFPEVVESKRPGCKYPAESFRVKVDANKHMSALGQGRTGGAVDGFDSDQVSEAFFAGSFGLGIVADAVCEVVGFEDELEGQLVG